MPFTDKQIAAMKPRSTLYERKEPGRTGLSIRITKRGKKVWTFVYRHGGAQKRVSFGEYPRMGVAAAHTALADAREKLRDGVDPGAVVAAQRAAERAAETVSELAEEYLARHARPNMKASTAAEDERMLRRDVVPAWDDRKANSITRRDAIKLLDEIQDRGAPVIRNRTAALLSRFFRFALDRGIVDASPAIGIRRLEETSRERFLALSEIKSFWEALPRADMTPAVRAALKFLLVTGQRRGEVAGTARSEINDGDGFWILPATRTKNGRENLLPLPSLAAKIIAEADATRTRPTPRRQKPGRPADADAPSPWLFPSKRFGKPIEAAALTRALNRNRAALGIGDATIHDLRRTFATWHGEIGTPPEILSALLNHTPATITAQVYDRSTNIGPRRNAMAKWCAWLERVIAGEAVSENVVRLDAKAR